MHRKVSRVGDPEGMGDELMSGCAAAKMTWEPCAEQTKEDVKDSIVRCTGA